MRQVIPLLLSVLTLVTMWQAGNRRWWAWLLGLVNQSLWFVFIVAFDAWGLLPLSVALTFVYSRNLWRWRREPYPASVRVTSSTLPPMGRNE